MTQTSKVQLPSLIVLAIIILAIACLNWAESFFKPLAVSVLLTILLSPLVNVFQKTGLQRVPSVILSSVLAFSLLGAIGWVITSQMKGLMDEVPKYKINIRDRILDLRLAGKGSSLEKVQKTVKEVVNDLEKEDKKNTETEKVVPVIVKADESDKFRQISSFLGPLLSPITAIGMVIVFVIFMLIELPDIRNRLIRLIGYSRLTITTKALDEAGKRITRYLVVQSLLNTCFGLSVGIGLFLMSFPYAIVWGFLAGFLRFIPYLGPWLGTILPFTVGLAVFDGWAQSFLVFGLFIFLELVNNLILEPVLYGHSAGVSKLSLLVAITFWTWLWGPIGLLLATPLTVCVVVLGKYIPELEFLVILLGEQSPIQEDMAYYQRLLAKDQDEALQVVESYLKDHPLEKVYDDLLLPALYYSKRDYARDQINEDDKQFIFRATQEIVEDLGIMRQVSFPSGSRPGEKNAFHGLKILACPASDEMDALALLMFSQLVDYTVCDIEFLPSKILFSAIIEEIEEKSPAGVLIGSLPPDMFLHARLMSKRLRAKFPHLKILVGRWGMKEDFAENDKPILSLTDADYFSMTLEGTRDQLMGLIQSSKQSSILV